MSNLTPKLEEQFERIYDMLDAASKGEKIGPLAVRDALKDLEAEVENASILVGEPDLVICPGLLEYGY